LNVPSVPAEFGQIFDTRVNHQGILVRTEEQVTNQINAYTNLGIGPFLYVGTGYTTPTYCGRVVNATVSVHIAGVPSLINPNDTSPLYAQRAFFELSQIVSDDETFYLQYYELNGPGAFYTGIGLLPGVSRQQMLNLLAEKNQTVFYSYSFPTTAVNGSLTTGYADFVRIGYVYHEIVSGDGVYLP